MPLSIGRFAFLPTLGIVTTLALMASFDGQIYLGGAIAVILGLIMHALTRRRQHAHT